jgi:fructose-1,6-bisphosphatase I
MNVSSNTPHRLVTIERHLLDEQKYHPEATGEFTALLYDIALAGKWIASHITQAGLLDVLGETDIKNVHGEKVQKLDEIANRILIQVNDHTGRLAAMVSEEAPDIISIPDKYPAGKYILSFDPLDGSSNIDINVSVGTVFAIHKRMSPSGRGTLDDCLQTGRNMVAAGYILYGTSTMFVYSAGHSVDGFTLDPQIGEFLLSHPKIHLPENPAYFSANLGYQKRWSQGVRTFTEWLQGENGGPDLSLRYIGSLVADFHRALLFGGIFYYPQPKLRLLYELNPLAFLMEQAGGYASDGQNPILDIQPTDLHQRAPVFMGNKNLVWQAEKFIKDYDNRG